jgi:SPP1 gp7 family putative phage head morphogenesis protein
METKRDLALKHYRRTIAHLEVLKEVDRRTREAELRLGRRMGGIMDKVKEDTLAELRRQGKLPTSEMEKKQIENKIMDNSEDLAKEMSEDTKQAAQLGRNRTVSHLQNKGLSIQHNKMPDRVMTMIQEHTFEASSRTMSNVVGNVMDSLASSYADGLGIDDAAARLGDTFQNMKKNELTRIARTEINSFQNLGVYETNKELGVKYHQWISASDSRTRHSHKEINGEIVEIGKPFSNGLLHPGDRSGPIEEWINCRCRLVPYLMPEDMAAPVGKDYFYEKDLVKKKPEEKKAEVFKPEEEKKEDKKQNMLSNMVDLIVGDEGRSPLKPKDDKKQGLLGRAVETVQGIRGLVEIAGIFTKRKKGGD